MGAIGGETTWGSNYLTEKYPGTQARDFCKKATYYFIDKGMKGVDLDYENTDTLKKIEGVFGNGVDWCI